MNAFGPWEEWMRGLPVDQAARAGELRRLFEAGGAPEPEEWVQSELEEEIPQLARFTVLKALYRDAVGPWLDFDRLVNDVPVAAALKREGVSRERLTALAGCAAINALYACLYRLAEGYDPDADPQAPGWALWRWSATGN